MTTSTHAFPTSTNSTVPGMTLRDYFAGQIAAGDAAAHPWEKMHAVDVLERMRLYYALADAMIVARNEPNRN